MARAAGNDQGKLEFVRQMLQEDSNANEKTVNQAWQDAGHQGSISRSSVGKVRAEMGLTNKRRPRSRKGEDETTKKSTTRQTGRRRGEAAVQATEPARSRGNGAPAESGAASASDSANGGGDRGRVIEELEGDLDRLLFRVMNLGGLTEVEELLRRSRRILILGSQG
jgi:hypothetical protein